MNSNTILDALINAGIPTDQPLTLTNPGGNNPWLFSSPASSAANAGAPVSLDVPVVQGESGLNNFLNGMPLPGRQQWYADGKPFLVRIVGQIAPNNYSKTVKLYLFVGNGLGSGVAGAVADVQIGFGSVTLAASSSGVAYSNFYLEAKCLWDSASLQMNGVFSGMIAGTSISAAAFSVNNPSAWAAQQAPGSYKPLSFVVGANIASSAAAGQDVVQINEFTAEAL